MCEDVFLILIDCLRSDYLGIYNPKRSCSPIIDGLALRSAVFTEAATHSPDTTPVAACLLTGMYPFHTSVRQRLGQWCEAGLPSIAKYASRAGFLTGGFPALSILNSDTGLARGFDTYRDITGGAALSHSCCRQSGKLINKAVDAFLADADRRRVFCFVQYADLLNAHLDNGFSAEADYTSAVAETIDGGCIGGLMDILRRHNRLENAAVILTGGPGEPSDEQPLHKRVLRVPLIWRWGKRTAAGPRIDRLVRHVDVLPTLVQLWGFPREEWPPMLDGQSLVPLLKGDPLAQAEIPWSPSVSYAEASPRQTAEQDTGSLKTFSGPERQSLRNKQYKFILHAKGTRELYDLQADPSELKNVADTYPRLADHFASELADMTAAAGSTPHAEYHEDANIEVHQRLHALGYIS